MLTSNEHDICNNNRHDYPRVRRSFRLGRLDPDLIDRKSKTPALDVRRKLSRISMVFTYPVGVDKTFSIDEIL